MWFKMFELKQILDIESVGIQINVYPAKMLGRHVDGKSKLVSEMLGAVRKQATT